MARWKELLTEMEDHIQSDHLAKKLGITVDELSQLDYEIDTDESKDGFIYNYIVEFDVEHSSKKILSKIKNLEDGRRLYLQPWDFEDYALDYDEQFQYFAIIDDNDFYSKFKEEMKNLSELNAISITPLNLQEVYSRHIFVGIIGTMETYLCDAFINTVLSKEEYLKNFVATHSEFDSRKFTLKEIFEKYDKIEEIAKTVMLDTIYHNLPIVKTMYRETFKIDFPSISEIYKDYVLTRHDLVHRNGKTKDGQPVVINKSIIDEALKNVENFVDEVNGKLITLN